MQPTTDPTDVASRDLLVDRARRGDQDAYCRLAEAAIGRVRRSARLILHDDPRAGDAVQEALVAAWRSLPGLRDPSRFDARIHRLLIRACYRIARHERRHAIAARRSRSDLALGRWTELQARSRSRTARTRRCWSGVSSRPSLPKIADMCDSTVRSARTSRSAMA